MSVVDSECDGVVHDAIAADNDNLRDYHRSAGKQKQQQPQQTAGVVAGNAEPPVAAGPEVHRASQGMAPPALRQPRLQQQSRIQQQSNGGDVGFVSVSSRKHRKLQDVFSSKSFQEKCILAFVAVLGLTGLVLTVIKIRGGGRHRTCTSEECLVSAESIMRSINVDVEPCDNFYEFACGKWQSSHNQRDSEKPNNWFVERSLHVSAKITNILEEPERENDLKSMREAKRLYRTCLDTDTLNRLGHEPVFEVLEKVGLPRVFPSYKTTSFLNGTVFNVARTLALIQRYIGIDLIFQMSLELNPNTNQSTITIGPVTMINSFLPEPLLDHRRNRAGDRQRPRDLSQTERDKQASRLVIAKVNYMVDVITYMFPEEAIDISLLSRICLKIIVLEVTLKKQLDLEKQPEEIRTQDLNDFMQSNTSDPFEEKLFDWASFIEYFTLETNATWTMNDIVMVRNKEYFLELQYRLINTPLEEIQQLLWWKIVESLISHTTEQMTELKQQLNANVAPLSLKMTRPQFCTSVVRAFVKGPIAYEFYARDNLKGTTDKVKTMIKQLQRAFTDMISEADWTDEATKEIAAEKANAMRIGVGYPRIFENPDVLDKNYDYIKIHDDQYLQSMLDIKSYEIGYILGMVGETITKDESAPKSVLTDPLEVNAYYSRMDNSINIPSGILQIPFFYKGVDVVNYGAIGTILGHEISHGFDIEGKDYDIHGKKTSQWSQDAVREYLKRAQCFIDQYDQFELTSTHNLNGTHTLAENMADNVGLKQSWKAYKSHNVGEEFHLAGLTEYSNDQLFFLSYANVWCQNSADQKSEKVDVLVNDEHSPSFARVLGSLRNSPEFAEVWKCPVGSPMNPSKKCSMW